MADMLNISIITDESGRMIEMAEARSIKHHGGNLRAHYQYYGRRNRGPWFDLAQQGNRIPSDW